MTTKELAQKLRVSESTIRRHTETWVANGYVRRIDLGDDRFKNDYLDAYVEDMQKYVRSSMVVNSADIVGASLVGSATVELSDVAFRLSALVDSTRELMTVLEPISSEELAALVGDTKKLADLAPDQLRALLEACVKLNSLSDDVQQVYIALREVWSKQIQLSRGMQLGRFQV